MQLKLLLVPHWVEKALKEAGAPKEYLLDPVRLSSILSKGDVSFYAELNEQLLEKVPPFITQTFERYSLVQEAFQPEKDGIPGRENWDSEKFMRQLEKAALENPKMDLSFLYNEPGVIPDAAEDSPEELYNNWELHGYEVKPITETVVGFYLKKLPIAASSKTLLTEKGQMELVINHFRALDAVIRLLLTHLSFERVCRTPIFTQFTYMARHGLTV